MPAQQKWNKESDYDGDLSNVPDEMPTLEASIYRLKIVAAERSPTKEGRPQIQLELKALHNLVTDEEAKGRVRFQRVLITKGDGGFSLKQLTNATGVDAPESQDPQDVDAFCEALTGLEVYAHVTLKKNGSDAYPNVRRYLSEEQAVEQAAAFAN